MSESVGIYISVPFCRAKCTYCNFASGVFGEGADGPARMDAYVDRVCAEIAGVRGAADSLGAELPQRADTIFLGGGTPSLLSAEQMARLFGAVRGEFDLAPGAEVTLECAPGQLGDETLDAMLRVGMNRVSFGVQSFVDAEARAVGRLHTREMCLREIERMRVAGLREINVDLIVGLPGQTVGSWLESVEMAIGVEVPHVSVYMLELDEDSRLGRETLSAGNKGQGTGNSEQSIGNGLRYGAGELPSEDETADWYGQACEWLDAAGIEQYEISNFARMGSASRHNVKYWRREAYVGFGLDAHSMLRASVGSAHKAVRWANTSALDGYLRTDSRKWGAGTKEQLQVIQLPVALGSVLDQEHMEPEWIGPETAFEETLFLGLRMNEGVSVAGLRESFSRSLVDLAVEAMWEMAEAGMLLFNGESVRLTARGRMASNEVFGRLLIAD